MDTLLSAESLRQSFAYWCKTKEIVYAENNRFEHELFFLHKTMVQEDHYGLDEVDVIEVKRLVELFGKPLSLKMEQETLWIRYIH